VRCCFDFVFLGYSVYFLFLLLWPWFEHCLLWWCEIMNWFYVHFCLYSPHHPIALAIFKSLRCVVFRGVVICSNSLGSSTHRHV
jgi:hypothetical protein